MKVGVVIIVSVQRWSLALDVKFFLDLSPMTMINHGALPLHAVFRNLWCWLLIRVPAFSPLWCSPRNITRTKQANLHVWKSANFVVIWFWWFLINIDIYFQSVHMSGSNILQNSILCHTTQHVWGSLYKGFETAIRPCSGINKIWKVQIIKLWPYCRKWQYCSSMITLD